LGDLPPDRGEVIRGPRVRVAYYDQQRAQLDLDQTVYEAASAGEDWVELEGRRIHLRDYLDDLLFPVPMQRMKVAALSGGERNRLLLARLFLEGANVLALDEPTNDLDLVTLNVLERLLLQFGGSVLLVTHDRYFLDKVATSILAFEGDGRVVRYEGNYDMYRRLRRPAAAPAPVPEADSRAAPAPLKKASKLSYKEQRELEGMESAIEVAERQKAELEAALADPATYAARDGRAAELHAKLEQASREVDRLYARWQALTSRGPG
jgi:ABC transport system ATP-binding/permease protein